MRATTFGTRYGFGRVGRGRALQRTAALLVAFGLLAVGFVVAAPSAFSQAIATVTVGACDAEGTAAPVTVTIFDDFYAVDIIDADGVATFVGPPGATLSFPLGEYTWIVFEITDEEKTPVEDGAFTISCVEETTTTTVEETTTTTVEETTTTTPPTESTVITSTTTTVPEEPTTTEVGQTTVTTVPPVTASTLPFTGSELQLTALLGGLAVVGGVMLVFAGRRRPVPADEDSLGDW